MKKFLSVLIAALLIVAMIVPVVSLADESAYVGKTYYVKTNTGKGLNMRNAASSSKGDIIASIPYGTALTVYNWVNNKTWAKVEYAGRVGYVFTRYLSSTEPAPISKKTAPAVVKTEDEIYDDGNPPLSLDIALKHTAGTNYCWEYSVDDQRAVRIVENGFYPDEKGRLGSTGVETFRIDGIAYGFAEVTFYYLPVGGPIESAIYSITYSVAVDENLEVRVFDTRFDFVV